MSRIILNLAGKKRTGKETAYKLILPYVRKPQEFQFATPLKKFCIDVLGLTEEQCYGTTRETPTQYRWEFVAEDIRKKYNKSPEEVMTAREVLQIVGTDLMRDRFYRNTWAYAGIRAATKSTAETCIFTDTRFSNELLATKDVRDLDRSFYQSIIIRLYRNTEFNDTHGSETALDCFDLESNQKFIKEEHYPALQSRGYRQATPSMWEFNDEENRIYFFDYLIDNNSGIDCLRQNMLYILKKHQIYVEPSGS